jgi:hypothetical protein
MQNLTRLALENQFIGLNDASPTEELPPGYFTKIDNALCSDGKVSKVAGSTAINASIASQPFNGLAPFEIISSSSKYLVASINGASNAQLYQSTGGDFSAIGSANLTNSKPVWFETANNIIFGFNGSEQVDWDGTTVTKNRSGVPIGNYAEWFHNYLFVAKTTANPNRLFWSNLGDPTTFGVSNFVDINPGDSDQIMGLAPFQDELLVLKRNTIWSITGFSGSSFSSTTIATQNTNGRIFGYGTVAPFSIVPVGNDVYFFSMLGNTPVIRSLRKTINAVTLGGGIISNVIQTTMANITLGSLANIVGSFDGRYCYWSLPTNGSAINNQIIVLDTFGISTNKNIYPFTTMSQKNASYFAVSTIPGYSNVYFADSSVTSGLVFKFDSSIHTDNGINITMDVRTRDYSSATSRKSKFKYLYLTYTSGSAAIVAVGAKINQGTDFTNQANVSMVGNSPPLGQFILGQSTLGGETLTTNRVGLKQILNHYMSLQFKDTTANAVVLHKWELWGQPKPLRGS